MRSESRFKSFDGTEIAYRAYGSDGEVPLLLCSGIACDEVYWTPIAPELDGERLVVTWDYPHHGDSSPAGDPEQISIESLARHATSLMDHLGIDQAAVGGHSMGVQVALETYRARPDAVLGLIAIAGPYGHTVGHLYGTNIGHHLLAALERLGRSNPSLLGAVWRAMVNPALADPIGRAGGLIGEAPRAYMQRYFTHLMRSDPVAFMAMFRAGHDHDASDLLPQIAAPVLVLHGTVDVMTPFALAERMCGALPDCDLVAIPGGAHTLPVEDPDLIVFETRRFLHQRVDQRSTRAKKAFMRS